MSNCVYCLYVYIVKNFYVNNMIRNVNKPSVKKSPERFMRHGYETLEKVGRNLPTFSAY